MIYTLTFNPCLDYVVFADKLKIGETNRSKHELIQFGGKGINVSTVLSRLGVPTVCLGFIAGFTGEALERAVRAAGVKTDFIKLPGGNTRINIKLKTDCETEINALGPDIGEVSLKELFYKLDRLTGEDTLVLAGSVPPSVGRDIYEKICERLCGRGVRLVVDAEGGLLNGVLKYNPFLIKPNLRELEQMAGRELKDSGEIIAAAEGLRQKGAQNVLVSLGKHGALLIDETGAVTKSPALGGRPVNTVGAGDSMVAGFLYGVPKGYAFALKAGLAAGGATACGEGLATAEGIFKLLEG